MENKKSQLLKEQLGVKNLFRILRRFGQDLAGILLMSISLITFLNLVRVTQGTLINAWSNWIQHGFGWASFVLLGLVFFTGLLILLRHFERFPKLDFGKILYLELFLFSLAAFLTSISGFSIERATKGLDGGVLGWGIARIISNLLSPSITGIVLFLVSMLFLLLGSGLYKPLTKALDTYFQDLILREKRFHPALSSEENKEYANQDEDEHVETPEGDLPQAYSMVKNYPLPPTSLLLEYRSSLLDESYIYSKAIQIENTLEEFKVPARVAGYRVGPTIIQYAVEPGYVEKVDENGDIVRKKVRVSQISTLQKDIALALSVDRLRIEAPIPGHSFVGIEIPNQQSNIVRLKPLLESTKFRDEKSSLNLALGLDVSGKPVVASLARMPHLLIAGTTGSGKSVGMASFIACLVMNYSPADLRLIILDPKMVELVRFSGLPHVMGQVETAMERMLSALSWAVKEMDNRIMILEAANVRDIDAYNLQMRTRGRAGLPKIAIFIDELADMMMTAPDQTEACLVRLAQMARATGIHLAVATQRPSTEIVTGLIKANFPARISYLTASSVDSRVILDSNGAETLMGKGDLLYLDPESSGLQRVQGVMMDDNELEAIIHYWQNQVSADETDQTAPWEGSISSLDDESDALLQKAIEIVRREGRASTSRLQRKLHIGFPRAARLMDELEEKGIVGPAEAGGREREVLQDEDNGLPEDDQN